MFKSLEITKKPKLIEICKNDSILNLYIPDKEELGSINRDFLLTVFFFINF